MEHQGMTMNDISLNYYHGLLTQAHKKHDHVGNENLRTPELPELQSCLSCKKPAWAWVVAAMTKKQNETDEQKSESATGFSSLTLQHSKSNKSSYLNHVSCVYVISNV